MSNQPREHHANLGTGNGLVQFVCCGRTERPFNALWVAPGGRGAANVFHNPRQAYDLVVQHLTGDQYDDATIRPVLEAADRLIAKIEIAEPYPRSQTDVRASIEYLAGQLDAVTITVSQE